MKAIYLSYTHANFYEYCILFLNYDLKLAELTFTEVTKISARRSGSYSV